MNKGLNNFDIIYYINLEHRKDRYDHIINELKKTNIDNKKINRIDGVYMKDFGILGCAKSHVKALEAFLETPDEIETCIIFEDDFIFTKPQDQINRIINKFFDEQDDFDVLMLASNILNGQPTKYFYLTKIIDAQTLSGYCVSKKFAPVLLANYKESISQLENVGYKCHPFCFDIYMKRLQPNSNWYSLNPLVGKQIESYSDIENKVVDYGC